jgi:hypothetical protein
MIVVIGSVVARREFSNPFSSFRDLLGDNGRQIALERGFTCPYSTGVSKFCAYYTDGMFSRIYLLMSSNDANYISFTVRENILMLGDLEVLWGRPEIRWYCETVVASWPADHALVILAVPQTGGVSRFTPILHIFFTRSGLPRWARILKHEAKRGCR